MNATRTLMLALAATVFVTTGAAIADPMGTAFTYQGFLTTEEGPVHDTCDFEFSLWNGEYTPPGTQIGDTQSASAEVKHGLFTVAVDFGADVLTGDARWLGIAVKCPPDTEFTPFLNRQELTPTPYALALPGQWSQQDPTSPNLIGGYSGNSVSVGVYGGTIGGGGSVSQLNRVTDIYGTVGGGANNQAGDDTEPTYEVPCATVAGGCHNTASGESAAVGGGYQNTASSIGATINGGKDCTAGGSYSTVGGGYDNEATAGYATIAGGGRSDPGDDTTNNRVTDDYGTIGGGGNNQAGEDDGDTTTQQYATVAGGEANAAGGCHSTVSGGLLNSASTSESTVGGGDSNQASGVGSTVSGGWQNTAGGASSTVGGGGNNTAAGSVATVGGGMYNEANDYAAAVGGGYDNFAGGRYSMIPGGRNNDAPGDYSFAAGRRAQVNALHDGAFVWADSNDFNFPSTAANEFSARATGGVRFVTAIGGTGGVTAGVALGPGDTAWSPLSDRASKENFAPVDGREILKRLASIPIETWNFRHQDSQLRHIGPMAQDFHAAFKVGRDNRHISTLDADGVALAAIQGLHEIVKEKDAKIAAMEARLAALEEALASLARNNMRTGGGR